MGRGRRSRRRGWIDFAKGSDPPISDAKSRILATTPGEKSL